MEETKPSNTFGPFTEGTEAAAKYKDLIQGKTVILTGVAENSLAGEAAIIIASSAPKRLILSARRVERAQPIAFRIVSAYPAVQVQILPMDLASLSSIRAAANELTVKVDVLINSAAVMACPYTKTVDGFESQFAVCHLGHFLFTNLLLKTRLIADNGRVVNISSAGHRFSDIRFDDLGFEDGKSYNPWLAYGQAKTANMLFTVSLAHSKRLHERGISSFSVHPGAIESNLGKHVDKAVLESLRIVDEVNDEGARKVTHKTLAQGTSTCLVAAFDPDIVEFNGGYLEDCQITKPRLAYAGSLEGAQKLWAISEQMIGEEFEMN
ncbi:NAD(P)-binding protein [Trichoderma velutinum]